MTHFAISFRHGSHFEYSGGDIVQTELFILFMLHTNQLVYLECKNILQTAQSTNTGQVPTSSQGPVDSADTNILETSTCLETTQNGTTNFTD